MSKLDQYISNLLGNDSALEDYLKDPKGEALRNGLSKADASILRRSVDGLPATAKSGLAITRPLSSYKSSLRLLQNVLHNYHGHRLATMGGNFPVILPTILIYYNETTNWKGAPVNDPHQAYTNHVYALYKNNNTSASTIGEAMGFNPITNPSVGDTVSGTLDLFTQQGSVTYTATYYNMGNTSEIKPYITRFVINLPSGTYDINIPLAGVTPDEHLPFWFYSVDGNAIVPNTGNSNNYHKNPDAQIGPDFISFNEYPLTPPANGVNTITWQAIAPDMAYGFAPCHY